MATIKLNKKHYYNNLDIITTLTKTKDKIAVVLKDNGYGHGLIEMATLASAYGITKAVVQTHNQAKIIEKYFPYILVLAEIPKEFSPTLRYAINDLSTIKEFPKNTKVELKIDTGMHRNGIMISEIKEAYSISKKQGLIVEAIFTHHRSADELSSEWFWQKENFAHAKSIAIKMAIKYQYEMPRFHSCNSAALLRENNFDEDMARVGIAAYGAIDMPEVFGMWDFKSVLSLHAKKNSTRVMRCGQKIGYGATCTIEQDCVISNYDFGYGDGFFRSLSNNYTTPQGIKLLGRISMDNSTFLSEAEEIEIFNDARVFAKSAGTFSYEVLTSLKEDIKREIV